MKALNRISRKVVLIFIVLISITSYGQDFFYRTTSTYIQGDTTPKSITTEASFQFNIIETSFSYNFDNKYFAYGAYNFDTFKGKTENCIFNCTKTKRDNNNSGFTVGIGRQNLGAIGSFKNVEVLLGYSFQSVDISRYQGSQLPENVDFSYGKLFAQFNMSKVTERTLLGLSLRIGMINIGELSTNINNASLEYNTLFVLDPTFSFHYKLISNSNLYITSQIGVSTALNNLKVKSSSGDITFRSNQYIIDGIAKIGLRYNFDF